MNLTQGELSSYMVFANRIKGRGWSKRQIRKKFLKEVDPEDYHKPEQGQILKHLYSLGEKS